LLAAQDLSVPKLPRPVLDALKAAPEVKGWPRSRPVTIADLGLLFENYQGPAWDNEAFFTGAMRLTGFLAPRGSEGLVFQSMTTDPGGADVRVEFHTVGFGAPPGPIRDAARVLIPEDDLEDDALSAVGEITIRTPGGRRQLTIGYRRHGNMSTAEAVVAALGADRRQRDAVFLTPTELVQHLSLPQPIDELFTLDEWQHPSVLERPSSSPDLQLAVEALRRRRVITGPVTGATWSGYIARRCNENDRTDP
jgi:hypothetical protein